MARPLLSRGLQVSAACWMLVAAVLWSSCSGQLTSSLPAPIVQCDGSGCTLNMAYGLWPDRSQCKAAYVVYPKTEQEIVAAVANAVKHSKKIKVSTTFGHSSTKVACPAGSEGVIISSRDYNAIVDIDKKKRTVTAQGGILLRKLVDAVAAQGLALPVTPGFDGVTLAGVIGTGAHGSNLFKGANLHEYVIGMRIVTPASKAQGYAKVRVLGPADEHLLKAARVSLGLLGVMSTLTIQLEPLFKRSVTLKYAPEDAGMVDEILRIARTEEFGGVIWYPALGQVVYKYDHRVPSNTVGDGSNNFLGTEPFPVAKIQKFRQLEELADVTGNRRLKCELAAQILGIQEQAGFGYYQNGQNFTGFPVIGPQNLMMIAGGCQRIEAGPGYACEWDRRVGGLVFFELGVGMPLRNLRAFLTDVRALRDAAPPLSLCDLDIYTGLDIRFAKEQTAYLGQAQEDMAMIDITFSRGDDPTLPRLDLDVIQELEQIAYEKYGAYPHWGKNRPFVFEGVRARYKNLHKFLAAKLELDPKGFFSSEWSDAILGLNHKHPSEYYPHCAIEGVCRCKTDDHCAPEKYSFCRPGRLYPAARVCRTEAPASPPSFPPAPA